MSPEDLARYVDAARLTGCADYDDPLDAARGVLTSLSISAVLLLVAVIVVLALAGCGVGGPDDPAMPCEVQPVNSSAPPGMARPQVHEANSCKVPA